MLKASDFSDEKRILFVKVLRSGCLLRIAVQLSLSTTLNYVLYIVDKKVILHINITAFKQCLFCIPRNETLTVTCILHIYVPTHSIMQSAQ